MDDNILWLCIIIYGLTSDTQVAVIAGNMELAEVIKNHGMEDVGKCLKFHFIDSTQCKVK